MKGMNERQSVESSHQLQGRIEGALFNHCALTKPRGIDAVLGTAGATFVIDILGDRVEQAPGGAFGGFETGSFAISVVERLDTLQGAFIG